MDILSGAIKDAQKAAVAAEDHAQSDIEQVLDKLDGWTVTINITLHKPG